MQAGPSRLRWRKCAYAPDDVPCSREENTFLESDLTAFEYFKLFFADDIIGSIVEQSNLYAAEKNINKPLNTNSTEMSAFMGILLLSGIVKVPSYRLYWANATRVSAIADVMPRNRFESIKWSLHFNDNSKMKNRGEPGYDKLFKLRPFIDAIRGNLLKIKPEEHNAIDEVLIPCKSRGSMIQYIKSKPHKWGIKVFARCGSSGMLHDFKIYTGKDPTITPSNMGVSGDVVVQLCEHVPKQKNFKIYTDNWFSSFKLTCTLKEIGIYTIGCIRHNRLPGCKLEDDKAIKKRGRGSYDYRVETSTNIIAVKWFDSKPIHMVSSFIGVEELTHVERWSSKEKKMVSIPRPNIIGTYNKYMGGVDLSDMLVALYRTDMGTKRYYIRVFHYFLDVTVANAWLLYRKHCELADVPNKNIKKLLDFRAEVARVLILTSNYPLVAKRGRPSHSPATSLDSEQMRTPTSTKRRSIAPPADIVRQHNFHLGRYMPKKQRCFNCKDRKSFSHIMCVKCNKYFCCNARKNCLYEFHLKA